MTTFDRCVEFVLQHEGGLSDDPLDAGGLTNFGISQRSYPNLDVRNLTKADAIEIYRRDYWQRCRCDEIPSHLATILFDSAVNQGPSAAIRMLQTSLNVKSDGYIGPITIAAALKADNGIVAEFVARRALRYATHENLERYGLGWFRRLAACQQLAITP